MYSFYLKVGKRWVRIGHMEFSRTEAVRNFQDALIRFDGSLRKPKPTDLQAELIALPAYGRTYTTAEAAIIDWEGQKDFINHWPRTPGTYCNKQDLGDKHVVIVFTGGSVLV